MQIDRAQIAAKRAAWRSIPPKFRAMAPYLASRVQLSDYGRIAAIFDLNGSFEIEGVGRCPTLGNLNDAEVYAVQALAKQECFF